MTTLAVAVTEAQMQAAIKEAAERAGALFFHDHDARRNAPGWPDVFCIRRDGTALVFELKRQRGRLRPEQRDWLLGFHAAGIAAYVVRPEESEDAIGLQDAIDLISGAERLISSLED